MLRLKSSVRVALALLVSLSASVLWGQAGTDSRPPLIAINGDVGRLLPGNGQSTLSVVVTDRSGNPLPNQPVLFVAPVAGATGTFLNAPSSDGSFFRVMTDGAGAATATFTANATPGVYLVEALVEGTAASVTFAITNVTGDVTPPPLAAADARAAVEQKLLFGTQLDETLRVHGPVLAPAGAVLTAAFVPTQPYTTDRQSWVFWVDEQPGFKFGHRVRFVILDAADTTADVSKARITREQSWPVVRLSADGAPNPLLPASGLNAVPFLKASNQPSQLRSIQPAGIAAFTPGACAILVHGVVPGGAPDVVNIQNFLVGSGRVSSANALTQGPIGRNGPATRQELAALIQLAADLGCKKVYLYISSHGTPDGSVVLINGTTGADDPVSPKDLQAMLAPLKGAEICPIIDACYSGALAPAFQGIGSTGTFVSASDATHTAPADVNGSPFTLALIKCWMDPKASSTGDGMVTLADAEKWVEKNAGQNVTGAKPLSAPINPKNIVLSIPAVSGKAGEHGTLVITRPSNYPLDMRIAAILLLPDTRTATLGRFGERTIEATFAPGDQTVTIQVNFKRDGEVNAFFDGTDPSNLVKVSGSVLISVGGPYAPVEIPPLISPGSTKPIQLYRFQGFEQTGRPVTIQVIPQDPIAAVPEPDLLTFDPYQVYVDLRVRAMQPGHTSFNILDSFFAYQDNFTLNVGSLLITGINSLPTISDSPLTYTVNGSNLDSVTAALIKIDTATTQVPAHDVTSSSFQFEYRFRLPGAIDLSALNLEGLISNTLREPVQLPSAPVVNNVGPSTFPASSQNQTLKATGTGFRRDDRVLVDFFDLTITPQGEAQVTYVDSTTLMVNVNVPKAGQYRLYVVDPFGQSSNKFPLTATPRVPTLTGTDPVHPSEDGSLQVLTFFGTDFEPGLTFVDATSDGRGQAISGDRIMHVSDTRGEVLIHLTAGDHLFQVINSSGTKSNPLPVTVLGQGKVPSIVRIDRAYTASDTAQLLTFGGDNFTPDGFAVVVAPGGVSTTYAGPQINILGSTSFQIQTVLGAGNYSIQFFTKDGKTGSNIFAFSVAPAVSTTPLTLVCPADTGQVNVPYSSALVASGGVPSYGFSIDAGNLPQGFTLNPWTGAITGTPGSAGTSTFTAKVVDSKATTKRITCTITDRAPSMTCTCPASSAPSGAAYNSALGSTGGVPPDTFSIASGSLPPGLTLNPSNGVITGTPNATGTSNFTAKVMDSTGTTGGMATANCGITITGSSMCTKGSDCGSGVCTSGMCQAPTCTDGVKNGQETDVDCGGPTCGKCSNNKMCTGNSDCQSNFCSGGVCQPMPGPTCTDGMKNGNETDVDCGGTCPACTAGKSCLVGPDCQSMVCTGAKCQAATCNDGVKNGAETDVDCGGPTCLKCSTGKFCFGNSDCVTNLCKDNRCQPMPAPSCTDGIKNGNETDIDCGGGMCPACQSGGMCKVNTDCMSGLCNNGVCQANSQMPVITAVRGPQRASPSPQHVMANGFNFQPGPNFKVFLIFPNNSGGIMLTGGQIQNETPISFEFDAVFQTAGDYMLRVQNPLGGPSDGFIVKIAQPL